MSRLWVFLVLIMLLGACSQDQGFQTKASVGESSYSSPQQCKANYTTRAVYGNDDRRDWHQVSNPSLLRIAKSTVSLMYGYVLSEGEFDYQISGSNLQESMGLCSSEKFSEQIAPAYCSGFLVAPDIIVTAGHCFSDLKDCQNTKFVFDFSKKNESQTDYRVSKASVFSCKELIAHESNGNDDYAVVRLDRPVVDREPLNIRREGSVVSGQEMLLIGHPSGLPSKIALGGRVKKINDFIYAEIDAFQGNSGSAVINPLTKRVEGILVAGEPDYRQKSDSNSCKVLYKCGANCEGELIVPISKVIPHIPKKDYFIEGEDPNAPIIGICIAQD